MNRFLSMMGVIALAAGLASTAVADESDQVTAAWSMIESGALLIDVRSPEEYAAGHLDGAVNIPHDQVLPMAWFIKDPSREVVVYCRSGKRAGMAAQALGERGFTGVFNGSGYEAMLEAKPD